MSDIDPNTSPSDPARPTGFRKMVGFWIIFLAGLGLAGFVIFLLIKTGQV